ncbi:MAG: hypothetical protein IBJ07_14780 [Rhizobiaceae bacterium]|nr:hypothetical protein [Rhizobiaceae bacterium]
MSNDAVLVRYAEGSGNNLGKAKNLTKPWGDFRKMFENPTRTKERRKQFDKLSKADQDRLKSVDGWLIGAHVDKGKRNNRNVQPRDLLSLDIDYATTALVDQIELGLSGLSEFEFLVHSSRRHTDEKPRLRLFAPLSRPAQPDEYPALARIISQMLDPNMSQVDKVSFRRAQMMFKPTVSADGDWFYHHNKGATLDVDAILDSFGTWRDISKLPRAADEDELRNSAEKAEDPTTKKGPVGDWCRTYDIPSAIETFLSDCYAPADDFSNKPRYSYLKGTSTSGAVVEDGGLFLYSHHGSDPCADMLVNSFDLVRIHLFGHKDEDVEKGTPPTKLPSYKAMVEFAREDPGFQKSQAESRYDMAAMFDDVSDDYYDDDEEEPEEADEETADSGGFDPSDDPDIADLVGDISDRGAASAGPSKSAKPKRKKPPKDWFPRELELDQNGKIANSSHNAAVIMHNDARMFEAIAFNEFTKQITLRRSIMSKLDIAPALPCRDPVNGDRWQEYNDHTVRMILEAPNGAGRRGYGMRVTDRDLNLAVVSAARRNSFHPVRDYFDGLDWENADETLIDRLFVDYLKVPDTEYHRQAARWVMVASVTRIYEPGQKFDYAPIIAGPQGIGKSTFIKILYGDWFGELDCKLDDRQAIAEAIAGKAGVELPELSGLHKSDHNAAKMFLRRTTDDVRMAYDRRTSEFPRQAVFWGTTNDSKYLKDPTGNRSYWPINSQIAWGNMIDLDALAAARDAIWASAVAVYRRMRLSQPGGSLPLTLTGAALQEATHHQEEARTMELHENWAEQIELWADTPVLLAHLLAEYDLSKFKFTNGEDIDLDPETTWVVRCAFRVSDASLHALGRSKVAESHQHVQNVDRALGLLRGSWDTEGARDGSKSKTARRFQISARWKVRLEATALERKRGWRVVDQPDKAAFDEPFGLDPDIKDLI